MNDCSESSVLLSSLSLAIGKREVGCNSETARL